MYQKNCLRHNVERKEKISDKQLPLHNRTHEQIQKYMFIFVLMTSVQILYVNVFVNQTGTEIFIYF